MLQSNYLNVYVLRFVLLIASIINYSTKHPPVADSQIIEWCDGFSASGNYVICPNDYWSIGITNSLLV